MSRHKTETLCSLIGFTKRPQLLDTQSKKMPGKSTEGFTKAAQKQKFVRHRDLKMKESELKQEAKVQKLMCEGVCKRCREKVQWRFRYDKYKSLRNPATCQDCKQRTITKAYRTLCDKCAKAKQMCPSCCGSMVDGDVPSSAVKGDSKPSIEGDDMEMEADEEGELKVEMIEEEEGEEADDEEENGVEAVEEDQQSALQQTITENLISQTAEEVEVEGTTTSNLGMETVWDERKFIKQAVNKYNKSRATGSEAPSYNNL